MKQRFKLSSILFLTFVFVALCFVGCHAVAAQSPGQGMGRIPGGPGGPGRPDSNFQKTNQYTSQFMRLINNIGRLEKDKKAALTPVQAKKILSVLQPLRSSDSLEESQAKKAFKSIQSLLTDTQKKAIRAMPAEHQFRKNTPPPAGPRPDGPPPSMKPGKMRGFNPLSSVHRGPTPPGGDRIDSIFKALEKKSKTKAKTK
jgi:hypothetical protein